MNDTIGQALLLMLLLVLPVSALAARRLPFGRVARYAGAWLAIFLLALLLVSYFT